MSDVRFLVASWSMSGHLRPLMAGVDELVRRGHDVLLVTDPGIATQDPIRGCQVEVLPPTQELLPGVDLAGFRASQDRANPRDRAEATTDHFLRQAEVLAPFVAEAVRRFRPDAIYRDYGFHAGWLAGMLTNVPVATFGFFPMPPSLGASRFTARYTQAIDTVGAVGDLASLDRWLTVYGLPRCWFGSESLPATSHLVQPDDPPAVDDSGVDELLFGLGDRPTVYATLGTVFNDSTGLWDLVFDGVASLDVDVIATVGASIDRDTISAPPNVRLASFVPQRLLLPHCDAVIAHGGYGTLMGALRAGIPVVSIPAGAADNVPNAVRLELLGAGRAVMSPDRCASDVTAALRVVLDDPAYRVAAHAVACEISELPPADHAATLLEQLAETGAPVLAG